MQKLTSELSETRDAIEQLTRELKVAKDAHTSMMLVRHHTLQVCVKLFKPKHVMSCVYRQLVGLSTAIGEVVYLQSANTCSMSAETVKLCSQALIRPAHIVYVVLDW